ncbi:MAG: CvpA family protein [Chloroflexi bacterium]|nr:CvpA family protein [Chloroflexota bacterium]MCL5274233.1 CvpA family protein [Chloroflexota bacterium]
MINSNLVFIMFVGIFGLVGAMRGWVREVIVTASLILALFVLNQLGDKWNTLVAGLTAQKSSEQWLLRSLPLFLIAFFGYLGPAVVRSRFEQNMRGKVEQGILAFLIGMINGYIIFSTVAFIAWRAGILDSPPPPGANQSPLFLAPVGGWGELFFLKSAAITVLSGTTLIVVLIAVFLFVIVVIV